MFHAHSTFLHRRVDPPWRTTWRASFPPVSASQTCAMPTPCSTSTAAAASDGRCVLLLCSLRRANQQHIHCLASCRNSPRCSAQSVCRLDSTQIHALVFIFITAASLRQVSDAEVQDLVSEVRPRPASYGSSHRHRCDRIHATCRQEMKQGAVTSADRTHWVLLPGGRRLQRPS